MSARWESLIPEALHGAVREALTATYGLAPVECLGFACRLSGHPIGQ